MSKILKICPYCGKQVPEGTKVCPVCKRSLTMPPPVEKKDAAPAREEKVSFRAPERPVTPPARRRGLSKGATAVLVIAMVVLIAAIVVLVAMFTGDGTEPLEPTSIPVQTPSPTFSVAVDQTPEPTQETQDEPETPEQTTEEEDSAESSPEQEAEGGLTTGTDETVWISGNNVNVRTGPGTEYEAIGSVNAGDQLQRTGTTENGWSRVTYEGQTAYVFSEFVSTTEVQAGSGAPTADDDGFLACSDTVTILSEANIRSGPGTDQSVIGVAPVGQTLTRTGVSGSWSRVTYDGQTGYVHNNLITASAGSDGFTACYDTVTVGTEANIRSGPGTDQSVVAVAPVGQTLTRIGVSEKWSKVVYDGQVCYVHNNMLR